MGFRGDSEGLRGSYRAGGVLRGLGVQYSGVLWGWGGPMGFWGFLWGLGDPMGLWGPMGLGGGGIQWGPLGMGGSYGVLGVPIGFGGQYSGVLWGWGGNTVGY